MCMGCCAPGYYCLVSSAVSRVSRLAYRPSGLSPCARVISPPTLSEMLLSLSEACNASALMISCARQSATMRLSVWVVLSMLILQMRSSCSSSLLLQHVSASVIFILSALVTRACSAMSIAVIVASAICVAIAAMLCSRSVACVVVILHVLSRRFLRHLLGFCDRLAGVRIAWVRVDLRRSHALVPKQLLHCADVCHR